jgi:predicted nucleic acid-binding protein
MHFLVDTGVLLRLFVREDPRHSLIREMVVALRVRGHVLVAALQNVAEFWNVCTRPATARGGYGVPIDEAGRRVRVMDHFVRVIHDVEATYSEWKRLVAAYGVSGVQVHDARLVALMRNHAITNVITLNETDFQRYEGLNVFSPEGALSLARSA